MANEKKKKEKEEKLLDSIFSFGSESWKKAKRKGQMGQKVDQQGRVIKE